MNSHSKWLRAWAVQLRKEGVIGGANTANQAADKIDRLETEKQRLYDHLHDAHHCQHDLTQASDAGVKNE